MITKVLQYDKYIIKRLGIGWVIKLINVAKGISLDNLDELTEVMKHFISPIPEKENLLPVITKIIEFNFKHNNKKSANNGEIDYDKLTTIIVHTLSKNYGWSINYILDEVDFYQAHELMECINMDKLNSIYEQLIITHSPGKSHLLTEPLLNGMSSGSKRIDLFDYYREHNSVQ